MHTHAVAMHMSDGLVNGPTSLLFGVVAAVALAIALTRARPDLDDRTAPMAGLVTAFVFAVQMINFPILPGASGHLLGGALVAILVGPWVGMICISIVLVVQCLLFADGGLTALGMNITNMAVIGVFTGYLVAMALRRLAARSRGGLVATAFLAAFL
ncbi:energy-coupling factor ABC transporter permease, partial [Pseudonocardia sp. KRD291]|uniref:energy-coupling factor ABC transporter permease n=1 Tax=Pseudonocardia sp. KRD291 TaxID=2792007 RepID=UPI001C4A1AC5